MDEQNTRQTQAETENPVQPEQPSAVAGNPAAVETPAVVETPAAEKPTVEKPEDKAEGKQARPNPCVCQVCGHINKDGSLICEMCSNYLID